MKTLEYQKPSMKITYVCKECGDIIYHSSDAIRHSYAEHRQDNMSPEEILDLFDRSLPKPIGK